MQIKIQASDPELYFLSTTTIFQVQSTHGNIALLVIVVVLSAKSLLSVFAFATTFTTETDHEEKQRNKINTAR